MDIIILHLSSRDMLDMLRGNAHVQTFEGLVLMFKSITTLKHRGEAMKKTKPEKTKKSKETWWDPFNDGLCLNWTRASQKRCYKCLIIVYHFENQEGLGGRFTDLHDTRTWCLCSSKKEGTYIGTKIVNSRRKNIAACPKMVVRS